MLIIIINGPNLNLLGKREPGMYGDLTFEEYFKVLKKKYPLIQLDYFQSNIEGELISKLHEETWIGMILNAGGYTHTSVSLRDAISAGKSKIV